MQLASNMVTSVTAQEVCVTLTYNEVTKPKLEEETLNHHK